MKTEITSRIRSVIEVNFDEPAGSMELTSRHQCGAD